MSDTVIINETNDTVVIATTGGTVGQGLTGGFNLGQTLAVSLTNTGANLASNTALTASYATLVSVGSLAAGTYVVSATASVGATNLGAALAASRTFGVQLFNGTTVAASTHGVVPTSATTAAQLASASLSSIVTLAATGTISLQIRGSTDLSAYATEQGSGGTAANATRISITRIA